MKMLRVISLLLLSAASAHAQEFVTDAFGVVPKDHLSNERGEWSDTVPSATDVEDILIFVGPKSLVAGRDQGHAVSILLDQAGNIVTNGTAARFVLGEDVQSATTMDGIAHILFSPQPRAGQFDAGVTSGATQSARASFRVTADLASIGPKVVAQDDVASLESFVEFNTEPLTDQFGNSAPSGVGAQMVLTHSDGSFSVMTPTVLNGQARAHFLVRDIPDGGALEAAMAGNVSSGSIVEVEATGLAGASKVALWAVPEIRATEINVGPVVTSAGHYLNDGANITVSITGGSGRGVTRSGWLRDGEFSTVLAIEPSDTPFVVTVTTALGEEQSLITVVKEREGGTR